MLTVPYGMGSAHFRVRKLKCCRLIKNKLVYWHKNPQNPVMRWVPWSLRSVDKYDRVDSGSMRMMLESSHCSVRLIVNIGWFFFLINFLKTEGQKSQRQMNKNQEENTPTPRGSGAPRAQNTRRGILRCMISKYTRVSWCCLLLLLLLLILYWLPAPSSGVVIVTRAVTSDHDVGATSHRSQEPWPRYCESPKESVQRPSQTTVQNHVVWSWILECSV